MEKRIEIVTDFDDIELGFYGEDDEFHKVEPTTKFEAAVAETIQSVKLAAREEIIQLAKRIETLEANE